MSADVILDTVEDPVICREHDASRAGRTAEEHGGGSLAAGAGEIPHGDNSVTLAALMRLPDHEAVIAPMTDPT